MPSVIGVLVLVAGVLLLIGRGYPGGIFDLLMGFNRWSFRVLAYGAFLTPEYPPFRLDQGGEEPTPSAGASSRPISLTGSRSAWRRCWSITRSQPACAYSRSRAATSSTEPTSARLR